MCKYGRRKCRRRLDSKTGPRAPIILDMHAALVKDFKSPPRYREIPPPVPNQGEVLLKVRAAALSNLVRGQANGSHYSSGTTLSVFIRGTMGLASLKTVRASTLSVPARPSVPWPNTPWFPGP